MCVFCVFVFVCMCVFVCKGVCVCVCMFVFLRIFVYLFSYVKITFVAEVALDSISAFVLRGNAWTYVKWNPEVAIYLRLESDCM
jgi:hypothetical protein